MARGYDGTIRIDTSIDGKGFKKGISGMVGALKPLAAAATALFVVLIGTKSVAAVAKLSAEFQRLQIAAQAVGQLHGIAAEETRNLTQELIDSGIQTDVANRSYIEFARNGLDTALLPALARGAQDLNVFSAAGETSSDVLDRLTYGILNMNALMLRRAGVAIDIENSWREYGATIGKTAAQMSVAEKRHAVLLAVTEKLRGVTGLYELSQKSVAGQLASNIRIMNEFKAVVGSSFQPAFFSLIKSWNTLVKAMTAAIRTGGALHGVFVRIGAIAKLVGDVVARLFMWLAKLFGYQGKSPVQAGADNIATSVDGIADSVSDATGGMDGLAKSTDKAGKVAKGALANFDELNVLAQPTDTSAAGTDLNTPGYELGEIDTSQYTNPMDEIIKKADELKEKWNASWFGTSLAPAFLNLLGSAGKFLSAAFEGARPTLEWIWKNILVPIGKWTGGAIVEVLDSLAWALDRMTEMIELGNGSFWVLIATTGVLVFTLFTLGAPLWFIIGIIIGLIVLFKNWGGVTEWLGDTMSGVWTTLKQVWFLTKYYFNQYVVDPIKNGINNIIDFLNRMIDAISGALNSVVGRMNSIRVDIPAWVPVLGGSSFGVNIPHVTLPHIPRLATGAVIPPNAEFLAVMGDQRSGRNIEAPENLIRQIMREEMGKIEADIRIEFAGTLGALVRELKPKLDAEGVRVGTSLISSGVVS
jgi:hypothetical protein